MLDTDSSNTALPPSILQRLGVVPHRQAKFELADGREMEMDIGRTWVRVNGDREITQVMFAEEDTEPILGMIILEEAGLAVGPVAQVRTRKQVSDVDQSLIAEQRHPGPFVKR